jgi:hypothetical protein
MLFTEEKTFVQKKNPLVCRLQAILAAIWTVSFQPNERIPFISHQEI